VFRGSEDGQLNIREQRAVGWCEACVVYAMDARDRKPCAGKKRGVRLRAAVVAVAPRSSGGGRYATRRREDCAVVNGVGPGTLHACMDDVRVGDSLSLLCRVSRAVGGTADSTTHTSPAAHYSCCNERTHATHAYPVGARVYLPAAHAFWR
jgi:hypothetical protein